jgi:hypothetical protein
VIDFRYHLVSLISVFLALAVGIILGAGPLQDEIGDQLMDQVEALRTERNTLREERDQAQGEVDEQMRFLQSVGPQLVAGSLDDTRVAVVDLDDVAGDVEQGVIDQLESAGATVVANAVLTESWTMEDEASFRETVATGLRDQLGELPEGAGPDEVLATALALALTEDAGHEPAIRSERAAELEELLVRSSLIDLDGEQTEPADAVLLLSGATAAVPVEGGEEVSAPTPEEAELGILATLAATVQERTGSSVVAGPTTTGGDLVSTIRGNDDLAAEVSTVSGVEKLTGRIVVPLALAASSAGEVGQYGFEEGATVLPLAVEETSPEPGTTSDDVTTEDGQ